MWFQLSMDAFSLYCALPVTIGPTGLPHLWCCLSSPCWSCGEDCFLMWSHLVGCWSANLLGEGFFHSSLYPYNSCCTQVFPELFLLWKRAFLFLRLVPVLTWSEAAFGAVVDIWSRDLFAGALLIWGFVQSETHTGFTTYFRCTRVHCSCLWTFFCGHGNDGTY